MKMNLKQRIPMSVRLFYRDIRSLKRYIISSLKLRKYDFPKLHFLSNQDAVDQIVFQHKSLARFGDGEFSWILGNDVAQGYQNVSEDLSNRLLNVLNSNDENLLLGVLRVLNDDTQMNFRARAHWRTFKAKYQKQIMSLLDMSKSYVDSSITRPYIDLKNKQNAKSQFDNLKRIWQSRDVLLIEGDKSRLGVGNDLFSNANSVRRILCPSKDAFDCYDRILEAVIANADENDLILLALGPTATILSFDLCRIGIQAVDIGHIDNEYEWMLMGATRKTIIPGKIVDEVDFRGLNDCENPKYTGSVVAVIK